MTDLAEAASSTDSGSPLPSEGAGQNVLTTVARNASFVLGAQVALKILAFLFNVYVVRQLGDIHFGQYATVVAYTEIFAIFTDWGMSSLSVREMAHDRSKTPGLLANTAAIRAILAVVVVVLAPLSAVWLGKEGDIVLGILIASAALILYAAQGPMENALTAYEQLGYTSAFNLINQLVFWGLGVLLLLNGMSFVGLLIARLVGVFVVAVLSGWQLSRLGVGRPVLSVRGWPQLLRDALPFGVSSLSFVVMQRFDTVLMSFVLTDAATGWYNVPLTLINMILLISQSIAIALFPSMVRSYAVEPESLRQIVWRSIKYLLVVCLPIAVGGTLLARPIILTLYEETFANSIPVLQVMVWALPSLFLLEMLGRVATVMHLERPAARINVISAGIAVVLNVILVPTLGIVGAAVALVAGRTIRLAQLWQLIGNDRLVGHRWGSLLRVGLAAACMGLVVLALIQTSIFAALDPKLGLLAAVGSGIIAYLLGLVVFGGVERRELAFLFQLATARLKKASVG